ncbi:hypothetical protein VT03_17000 [Planctomyces sp. SH-PL14]|nr:hypothetical protein VT03_17000 [Planctomyces sp. SH-PL14]
MEGSVDLSRVDDAKLHGSLTGGVLSLWGPTGLHLIGTVGIDGGFVLYESGSAFAHGRVERDGSINAKDTEGRSYDGRVMGR